MPTIKSAIRYAQISGLSFVVNIGLTIFLHEVCAVTEEIAYAIALIVVFSMNFVAMRHYIYQGHDGPLAGQLATYTMAAIGFRGTEYLSFLALHSWLGFDYRLVVVGVTLVAAGVKFFFYKFVFEGRESKPVDCDGGDNVMTLQQRSHPFTTEIKQQPGTWLFVAALGLLGAAYCLVGLYCLMVDSTMSFPTDLRYRWLEQYTMYQGGNPQAREHHDSVIENFHHTDVNAISNESTYPPWSYFTGIFLVPPLSWELSRYYFGVVDGIAMAIIACWAHATGKRFGKANAALCACAVLAMCPMAICVSYGQYTVFVMACLIGALLLCERGRDNLAGVCLGLAMIKPHVAALFVLPMLARGKIRVIVAMMAYMIGASCVTWLITGIDPLTMLMAGFNASRHVLSPRSHNTLILAARDAFGPKAATLLMASVGGGLCLVLVFLLRKQRSLLASFSVCAIICMFWSYRKHYDCVLLGFPLVCLLVMARQTKLWPVMGLFLAFGASIWYPIRYTQWHLPIVNVSHTVLWLLALVVIAVLAAKGYGDLPLSGESKVMGELNPPPDDRPKDTID